MKSVEQIAAEIVAREGGYVDDPDDPGGATNHGVTIHTMRRLGLDLDGDGVVTKADVRRLTPAQATEIFIEHYYRRPRIDALPESLRASVFDMHVNSGANAVKILQRLLVAMRIPVVIDGIIGPQTIAAAAQAQAAAPDHLADAYGIARRNYYYSLADSRPASRKYARARDGGKGGWIRRAEEFISPRYHLTETQHRERTAAWG
ncbi:holin-associated N-acetylmuramidase [Limimaricola litoreus]|uniref:Holin-associated N-acetylmuramidase n=1 Tax=Limimaricola litoreus TaxID=2955316 RepID=A0A9X2FXE9_9RHOB|nr:holin-associated N-acetylmuramidase [Limimaricola litoreus]MCP1170196.1 holin-associated N-acetylmuramidase [Limimaricola litoreus]